MVNKVLFHKWHASCYWRQQTSCVTPGEKSLGNTNEMICNQHKPSISVFICDIDSIKDCYPFVKFMKAILLKPNIVSTERRILHLQVLLECCYIYMENSQREHWNYLLLKRFRSSYEVDQAIVVVSVSSSSGK